MLCKSFMREIAVNNNEYDGGALRADVMQGKKFEIAAGLLMVAAFCAPFGAHTIALNIAIGQLSIYRVCLLLLIAMYLAKGYLIPKTRKNQFVYFFIGAWVLYASITIIWAKDYGQWFRYFFFLVEGFFIISILERYSSNLDNLKKVTLSFFLGIQLQAIIGWYEMATKNYHFMRFTDYGYRYYVLSDARVPIAMLGNPNDFATLMFAGVFLALFLYYSCESRSLKRLCIVGSLNCAALIFSSTSRANMIGLIIFVLALMVIQRKKVLAVACVALVIVLANPSTSSAISGLFSFRFDASVGSDVVRLNLIKTGFEFLFDTAGFGVGTGQLEYWYANVGSSYYIGGIRNVHNMWAEILFSFGVIVFICFIAVYFRSIRYMISATDYSCTKNEKRALQVTGAFLIGLVVACVSSSSVFSSEWFWLLLGIIFNYQTYMMNRLDNGY